MLWAYVCEQPHPHVFLSAPGTGNALKCTACARAHTHIQQAGPSFSDQGHLIITDAVSRAPHPHNTHPRHLPRHTHTPQPHAHNTTLPTNSPHVEMLQGGEFLCGFGDLCSASIANRVGTAALCSGQEAPAQITCPRTSPKTHPTAARPEEPRSRIFTDYYRPQWCALGSGISRPSSGASLRCWATGLSHALAVPSPTPAVMSASHKHASQTQTHIQQAVPSFGDQGNLTIEDAISRTPHPHNTHLPPPTPYARASTTTFNRHTITAPDHLTSCQDAAICCVPGRPRQCSQRQHRLSCCDCSPIQQSRSVRTHYVS